MPIIQWTPDFSVGVGSIDTDHKVLISLINQLDDAIRGGEPKQTVSRVLDALLDYTNYHFAREELLMRACAYPDIEAHARTHATLRAQVHDIRNRYRRNPESIHAREVLAFLKNWLTAHIVGRDKLYAPFMQSAVQKIQEAEAAFGLAGEPPVPVAAGR
jgi:hemerythrin-like metal-binding protein